MLRMLTYLGTMSRTPSHFMPTMARMISGNQALCGAYCISENKWYVKPAKMPKDWGAKSFALPLWENIEKTIKRVDDVLAKNDP